MKTTDCVTPAMSVLDGCRAAAEMVSDGRLQPSIPDVIGDTCPSRTWGDPDFNLEDAAISAFLGDGCEAFSRHRQMLGVNWRDEHLAAFTHGFITVAQACLWVGGLK